MMQHVPISFSRFMYICLLIYCALSRMKFHINMYRIPICLNSLFKSLLSAISFFILIATFLFYKGYFHYLTSFSFEYTIKATTASLVVSHFFKLYSVSPISFISKKCCLLIFCNGKSSTCNAFVVCWNDFSLYYYQCEVVIALKGIGVWWERSWKCHKSMTFFKKNNNRCRVTNDKIECLQTTWNMVEVFEIICSLLEMSVIVKLSLIQYFFKTLNEWRFYNVVLNMNANTMDSLLQDLPYSFHRQSWETFLKELEHYINLRQFS